MEKDKAYLPEDDRVSHEYDNLSKEELLSRLEEIEKEQKRSNN